jgi:phospholipase C
LGSADAISLVLRPRRGFLARNAGHAWFRGRRGGISIMVATLAWLPAITHPAGVASFEEIRHIVIVVQENRTPDNLFGAFRAQLPGADLVSSGVTSSGETVPLTPISLAYTYDLDHSHAAFVSMYDNGQWTVRISFNANLRPLHLAPPCRSSVM